MRYFPVPMDLTQEEKIIGGVLSIRQVVYLLIGGIFSAVFALVPIFILLKIPLVLFFLIAAPCLAFVSVKEIHLDLYLLKWFMFWRRTRRWRDSIWQN